MPRQLKLGAMIEVPSLLFQLDELMALVDFVSIGSNDLFQFFSAVDRGNARMAGRFDDLSPPFLSALKSILDAGTRNGVEVGLCGEMAGKPLAAMALMGLGFRSISMTPSAIGPVKAMMIELELEKLQRVMADYMADPRRQGTMRQLLVDFAEAHSIPH